MEIRKKLHESKEEILEYLRDKADIALEEIQELDDKRKKSRKINSEINRIKDDLIGKVQFNSKAEDWSNDDILNNILMITYCSYIVMIEYRNKVWPYEYMTFSRRIGELWDPFCQLCWEYNQKDDIKLIEPPAFDEVKTRLREELGEYIESLGLEEEQEIELKEYYEKVWKLVTSGDINMSLDLHFSQGGTKYMVDLKSGFGSNEKGNTNRLLMVASIYEALNDDYKCILFVRSSEDETNNYFKTLKNSDVWEAYTGVDAYEKMEEFTGFNIKNWIIENVNWEEDFDEETMEYFRENNLDTYLNW